MYKNHNKEYWQDAYNHLKNTCNAYTYDKQTGEMIMIGDCKVALGIAIDLGNGTAIDKN